MPKVTWQNRLFQQTHVLNLHGGAVMVERDSPVVLHTRDHFYSLFFKSISHRATSADPLWSMCISLTVQG